jgi:hypothetical protein
MENTATLATEEIFPEEAMTATIAATIEIITAIHGVL